MKRGKIISYSRDNKPFKSIMVTKNLLALMALAVLCISAAAQENTAEGWYKKGQELERNGSWGEAVNAYDRAIELSPNNATFYTAKESSLNMLALITNNQSKRNESMKALDKALQIDSKNPRAWDLKGSELSQMKKYNESLEAYDKAIENIGNYKNDLPVNRTEYLSGLWLSKAVDLWQMGITEKSLNAFDKAVQIDPNNYDAWIMKGNILTYLRKYNESLRAYDRARGIGTALSRPELEASPEINKGYTLMATGKYDDARKAYENVTELNFTGQVAGFYLAAGWWGIGNSLAKIGIYNESIKAFDKVIELNPERAPYAWTNKGDALRDLERYEDAIKAYDKALELYPEFANAGIAQAWKGKGDVLIKLNRREAALKAYDKAVKAYDEEIKAFNNATALDKAVSFTFNPYPYPLDAGFWYSRGTVLKALGLNSEADAAFSKAEEIGRGTEMAEYEYESAHKRA